VNALKDSLYSGSNFLIDNTQYSHSEYLGSRFRDSYLRCRKPTVVAGQFELSYSEADDSPRGRDTVQI
jgi:hypothetical protein